MFVSLFIMISQVMESAKDKLFEITVSLVTLVTSFKLATLEALVKGA